LKAGQTAVHCSTDITFPVIHALTIISYSGKERKRKKKKKKKKRLI
jgi:hypothetical protein